MRQKALGTAQLVRLPLDRKLAAARFDRALDALRAAVVARRLHMSSVRGAILRVALELTGHFDAQRLARALRESGTSISLTAVYRNLPLLMEAGLIRPTLLSQGTSGFYEVTFERPAHDHLVCRTCGAVIEFQLDAFAAFRRDVATMYAFELESHVHEMIGVCAGCRGFRGRERAPAKRAATQLPQRAVARARAGRHV